MSFLTNRKSRRDSSRRQASPKTAEKISRAIAMVDPLERRVMLSYSPSGSTTDHGVLTGDGTAGEKLVIDQTSAGLLEWNDGSGFTALWGPGVIVHATATSTVTINPSGTGQTIVIGSHAEPASTLGALFILNADGEAGDTVTIDDSFGTEQADPTVHPYAVDLNNIATEFSIMGPGINFQEPVGSTQGGITLLGSKANDTYDVYSTYYDPTVPGEEPFTIVAGPGTNTVNIGDDPINPAATVANINATVHVTDPTGTTALTINDQGDTNSTAAIITNSSVTGLSPAPIDFVEAAAAGGPGVTSLTVLGGPGLFDDGIDYNIQSTGQFTPLQLTTDGAFDTVEITNNSSLAGIDGNISLDNASTGAIELTIDGSADTNSTTATLSAVGTEATLAGLTPHGSTIMYSAPTLNSLAIDNTSGTDLFTVNFATGNPIPPYSTSSGFYYNGGGGPSSALVVTGGMFTSEVNNAYGPGYGDITWTNGTGLAAVVTYLNYSGLTPLGDNTAVTNYTFNDFASPDDSYILQNGTLGLIPGPSLEFAATGSGFETTDVNNKTNVQFIAAEFTPAGGEANVTGTPTGLSTLKITSVAGDSDLYVLSLPTGVTSSWLQGGQASTAEVEGNGLNSTAPGTTTVGDGGGSGNNTLTYDFQGNTTPFLVSPGPAIHETIITQNGHTLDAKRYSTIDFINSQPPTITFGAPFALTGVEGTTLSNVKVASFTTNNLGLGFPIADYNAAINWGDGFTGGTVVQNVSNPNQYYVFGTHTYAKFGAYKPVVTVRFTGGTNTLIVNGVTYNIMSSGGTAVSVTDTATIADAPLLVQVTPISAVEGVPTGPIQVASMSDFGGAEPAADYAATVNYGDGTPTVTLPAGSIVLSGANFVITDGVGHTFIHSGIYVTTVSVTDLDPGTTATVGGLAHVSAAPVVVVGVAGATFSSVEGASYAGPVATITTPDTLATPADFFAHISWGDGTSSTGVVSGPTGGPFTVTGPHTYAEEGTYHVSVTVSNDLGSPTTTVFETALVSDPSVIAAAGSNLHTQAGASTGVATLATFTDPGGPEVLTDYSDSVNWGDGSFSSGVITVSGGTFSVKNSHIYTTAGLYTITVTIYHDSSTPQVVTLTDLVYQAPLSGTGNPNLKAVTNTTFSQVLATFQDANPYDTNPANYTAIINWGDKLPPNAPDLSAGTITYSPITHLFSVSGTHKYLAHGTYTVTITVQEGSGTPIILTSKITV